MVEKNYPSLMLKATRTWPTVIYTAPRDPTGLLVPNGAPKGEGQLPYESVSILHGLFRFEVRGSHGHITEPTLPLGHQRESKVLSE